MISAPTAAGKLPEFKWKLLINPGYSWFRSFAEDFSSPDLCFLEDVEDDRPPVFWLTSRHLAELTEPEDVYDRAYALKVILDGALHLGVGSLFGRYHPFDLQELWSLSPDGRPERPHSAGGEEPNFMAQPFSSNWRTWIPEWRDFESPFNRFESAMMWMARVDDLTRGMLQFIGANGVTWISLYGMVDFMRTSGKTPADIVTLAKSSKKKLDLFMRTANNFAAIGPFCRHGDLGDEPPKNPMKLEEARQIVFGATREFLEQRLASLGLAAQYASRASL